MTKLKKPVRREAHIRGKDYILELHPGYMTFRLKGRRTALNLPLETALARAETLVMKESAARALSGLTRMVVAHQRRVTHAQAREQWVKEQR